MLIPVQLFLISDEQFIEILDVGVMPEKAQKFELRLFLAISS